MPSKRKNKGRSNVARVVSAQLRRMHLNAAPTWHLVPHRNPNQDPPAYTQDAIYTRKVRVIAVVAAGSFNIYPSIIIASAGLSSSAFETLTVTRIKAYGTASVENNGLRLLTRLMTLVTTPDGDPQTLPDREFLDWGTQGSRRPFIDVEISPKDQGFIDATAVAGTAAVCTVQVLNQSGLGVAGNVIVDFFCQFRNSAELAHRRINEFWKKYPDAGKVSDTENPSKTNGDDAESDETFGLAQRP